MTPTVGTTTAQGIAHSLCVAFVALTWLSAGIYKLTDLSEFSETVAQHGVLPDRLHALLPLASLGEIVLGLVIGSSIGTRCSRLGLAVSLAATMAFIWYVAVIPERAIAHVGCGCGGFAAISQQGPWDARQGHLGYLTLLAFAHFGCMLRRKKPSDIGTGT